MSTILRTLIITTCIHTTLNNSLSQWIHASGSGGTYVSCFSFRESSYFAGTYGNGIYRSTDGGRNWIPSNIGLTGLMVSSLVSTSTVVFAGTFRGVFRSTNDGLGWTAINSGLTDTIVYAVAGSNTNLFAGTWGGGVFRSTDSGIMWSASNAGLTDTRVFSLTISGTNLFAGTLGGVFRSTNNGTDWIAANTGLTDSLANTFAIIGENVFAGTQRGVFRSTNGGSSWTSANTGLRDTTRVIAMTFNVFHPERLFVGTYYEGIFLSTNSGSTWTVVNIHPPFPPIWALILDDSTVFAGTYFGGVYWAPLSGIIVSVDWPSNHTPQSFRLEQNYPNPFNASTKIQFSLPRPEFVTMKVFNTMGQQIAVLVSKNLSIGAHQVEWNGEGFPSGVYFYRLQAGGFSETRRLISLK